MTAKGKPRGRGPNGPRAAAGAAVAAADAGDGVSITKLAERLGLSRKAVTGHLERGTVPTSCFAHGPNGRVLVDADGAAAAIQAAVKLRAPTLDVRPELAAGVDFEAPTTWPRDLGGLRLVREFWVARAAKRKDDLQAGELVRGSDVHREIFGATRLVRDQLLALPDRAADDLAAELGLADAAPVRAALRAAVERGLADLARALDNAARAPAAAEPEPDQGDDAGDAERSPDGRRAVADGVLVDDAGGEGGAT